MQLILFDFDGTLTKRDSLWAFLFFSRGRFAVFVSILALSPMFAMYACGVVDGGKLKERLLRWHFKGVKQSQMESWASEFNVQVVNRMLRPELLKKLVSYKNNGDEVCIVTASCDVWIRPFCRQYNCSYLATEMEFANNEYSGNFKTLNCNKEEKSNRIRTAYKLADFDKIIAFGNSDDDIPMFALANEIHRI